MATIGSIDGSKFIGCPIVVPVTAGSYTDATFHLVRIVITVSGSGNGTFESSKPAANGETVQFDLSSALQAMADKHEYSPTTLSGYPVYGVKIDAYDDYMKDGVAHEGEGHSMTSLSGFIMGTLTDRERQTGERPTYWSRKPTTTPEICLTGNPHIQTGSFSGNQSARLTPDGSQKVVKGLQTIDGYQVYGVDATADGFELRFINSLGVHENVFITCLRQSEVNFKNDFYTIARQETLTKFSRGVSVKQNDYETWKMSSGPVDRAWQQWWLHEPLMAKWAWLNVDSQWLPVHIVPEETTVGIDRAKGNLLEVQFTIRFDINGSPFKS